MTDRSLVIRRLPLLRILGALLVSLAFAGFAAAQESKPESKPAAETKAEAKKPEEEEAPPKEEKFLAIVGGDVETVSMGRLKGATVLIKGTKIWKVGRNVAIPESASRIDASGLRVYPGLVAARANGIGVSGFGGGGGKDGDRYDPFGLNVQLAIAGGLTTVCQGDTVIKVLTSSIDDLVLREPALLRLQYTSVQQRYDLREKLERARQYIFELREYEAQRGSSPQGAPAASARPEGAGGRGGEAPAEDPKAPKAPSRSGVDMNLVKLLQREVPARFEVDDASEMLPILELLDEFRFDCTFSGALEAWTIAGELSRRGVSCILSPRRRQASDERADRTTGSSAQAAAILRRAGIELALYPPPGFDGGDTVGVGGIAGRDLQTLPMDAAWAIRGGLDEQSALESITLGAARILGVDHRIGSIEPGKDADLILTDGPIFDFRTFVQMSIVNGEVQYEKAKSSLFRFIRPLAKPPGEVPAFPEKPAEPASPTGEGPATTPAGGNGSSR